MRPSRWRSPAPTASFAGLSQLLLKWLGRTSKRHSSCIMSFESEITLGQVCRAIFRHRSLFLSVLIAVAVLTAVGYKSLPRRYGSEGRLYVQAGRANSGLDPTTSAKPISIQDTRETEVRSVMELLKSRAILQRVVEEVGPGEILSGDWELPVSWTSFWPAGNPDPDLSPQEYEHQKQIELAVKKLEKGLTVHLEKSTSVISVFVVGPTPRLAQTVVDRLMQYTREKHVEVHASAGSREFFQKELDVQREKLETAILRQRDFRNQHGFLSVDSARATEQMVLDRLETQAVEVNVDLEAAERRCAELAEKLKEIPAMLDTAQQGKESLSTERARSEVFYLEAERAKMLATYSEAHPRVRQISDQIEGLRAELAKLPVERTETIAVANKAFENIQTEHVSAVAALQGLLGRQRNLQAQRRAATDRLERLNQLAVESEQLQQDIDIARRHLDIYIQKQGEAQVLDQLDRDRISDVVVAQPAMLQIKHVSPNAAIILPLGALCGLILATVVVVVRDWREGVHPESGPPPAEVDDSRSLPVLADLPRVASRRAILK